MNSTTQEARRRWTVNNNPQIKQTIISQNSPMSVSRIPLPPLITTQPPLNTKPNRFTSLPSIHYNKPTWTKLKPHSYRITTRGGFTEDEEDEEEEESCSFEEAVSLFNKRDYYKCHDVLESLWNKSQEPSRTLVHGILQCAVGFHHLFNQNHKGAMMELGEGVCKLRKMNFESGPFHQFEREISAVLEFIYQTQLEQAACNEDHCVAMDQSERSYQLLGGYAAGERIYHLEIDRSWNAFIVFQPERYEGTTSDPPSIKIPVLKATEEHIMDLEPNL